MSFSNDSTYTELLAKKNNKPNQTPHDLRKKSEGSGFQSFNTAAYFEIRYILDMKKFWKTDDKKLIPVKMILYLVLWLVSQIYIKIPAWGIPYHRLE